MSIAWNFLQNNFIIVTIIVIQWEVVVSVVVIVAVTEDV